MTGHDGVYAPAGFFLLRAPVLSADTFHTLTAPHGDTRERLTSLAGQARVAQALHVGSPSLSRSLAGPRPHAGGRKVDSGRSALLRYLTRMATRPTPYGLFAGVAFGGFEPVTSLALAADPVARTRTRADAGWLLRLVKDLESDDELRDELRVRVNPMLYRAGGRAILPAADIDGTAQDRLVSVRVTPVTDLVLRLAPDATSGADLVEQVCARVPGAGADRVRRLLAQLWELHILTSDLRPSMTAALPEQELVKRLDSAGRCAAVLTGLREVRALAAAVDAVPGRAAVDRLDRLGNHQRAMTPDYTAETYQLDTHLALAGRGLSDEIGAAAADAAETLLRLGALRERPQHIVEYHHAFLEHYGVDSEVPVLELLSPESGLDAPATYAVPPRPFPLPVLPEPHTYERDAAVTALAAEALHYGRYEVELTDEWLDRLTVWRPDSAGARPRPSLDLFFQLAAASRAAVDAGDWRMVLSPAGMAGGAQAFGRFFDLFDEASLGRLREFARAEEALCPDLVFAELNYVPSDGRGGNVAVHPALRRYEICVNTSGSVPADRQIPLTDLVVGATAHRFYVRSVRLGRELMVTQGHVLSPVRAPNVCRLLLELSEDGFAPYCRFDWGPLAPAPFLPRLTRGRVVLAPAQWLLTTDLLQGGTDSLADADRFAAAVRDWRTGWRVPRHAYLTWADNRLLLDLDHPMCLGELWRHLRRAPARLQEPLPDAGELWLADGAGRRYHSELVVPVLARDPERVRRPPVPAAPARSPAPARRRWLPGDRWVYFKLYSAVAQHDDVIAGPLRELVAGLDAAGLADRWFYIRYCDPLPHLRIRVRAGGDDADPVLSRCVAWAGAAVRAGLASDVAFVSYQRELERYGGPLAIDLAEEVFHANSGVSADLLALLRRGPAGLTPEVVCVLAMHALHRDWGLDPLAGPGIGGSAIPDPVRKEFRQLQPLLCDLLAPWDARPDPTAREHLDTLDGILARQRTALVEAGTRIRELTRAGRLTASEHDIVDSLTHMQANRLLGVDRERERRCHHLWSLAARAIRGRPAS